MAFNHFRFSKMVKKMLDLVASSLFSPSQCFTLQTSSKDQSILVAKEDARIFYYLSALSKDSAQASVLHQCFTLQTLSKDSAQASVSHYKLQARIQSGCRRRCWKYSGCQRRCSNILLFKSLGQGFGPNTNLTCWELFGLSKKMLDIFWLPEKMAETDSAVQERILMISYN